MVGESDVLETGVEVLKEAVVVVSLVALVVFSITVVDKIEVDGFKVDVLPSVVLVITVEFVAGLVSGVSVVVIIPGSVVAAVEVILIVDPMGLVVDSTSVCVLVSKIVVGGITVLSVNALVVVILVVPLVASVDEVSVVVENSVSDVVENDN